MRKFFALTLTSYLLAFSMPFMAMAETTEEEALATEASKMCPFGINNGQGIDDGTFTDEEKQQVYETYYETFNGELQDSLCDETGEDQEACWDQCGEPNSYTGYIEKGDCSSAGLVVTEITEVISPDVDLEEGGNRVVTVYSGMCCLAGEVDGETVKTCDDTRTLYTETYTECDSVAVNCEKRQWVIGSSGIGIVKLMVKQIFTFGALAVGSIAVATIVFQGIKISVSGVSGDITESKNKILQAIGGIVLLFLSGLILYAINPTFFG